MDAERMELSTALEMKVLAIIVTYNAEPWIERCIESVLHSTQAMDVVVYDNGSKDNTLSHLKKYREVELIQTGANLGFGRANNLGLKRALDKQYDYVLLLNQDAWLEHNVVEELIAVFQQNKSYGILSPVHYTADGHLEQGFKNYMATHNCLLKDFEANQALQTVYSLGFINAAIWLVPVEVIGSYGGFDPVFPHYGEDTDLVNRLRYHGLKIGVVPALSGVHDRAPLASAPLEKRKYFEFINYLVNLKNLEQRFWVQLLIAFQKIAYYTLIQLAKGQWALVAIDFRTLVGLFKRIPAILKSRKQTRESGRPWFLGGHHQSRKKT